MTVEELTARERIITSLDETDVRVCIKGCEGTPLKARMHTASSMAKFDLASGAHITGVEFKRIDVQTNGSLVEVHLDLY